MLDLLFIILIFQKRFNSFTTLFVCCLFFFFLHIFIFSVLLKCLDPCRIILLFAMRLHRYACLLPMFLFVWMQYVVLRAPKSIVVVEFHVVSYFLAYTYNYFEIFLFFPYYCAVIFMSVSLFSLIRTKLIATRGSYITSACLFEDVCVRVR